MMKVILLVSCLVAVTLAMSRKEIEAIREELNGELSKLENDSTKKSADNEQIASIEKFLNSAAKPKKLEEKDADKFLTNLIKNAKKDHQDLLADLLKVDSNKKRSAEEESNDAYFHILFNDIESSSKRSVASDSQDEDCKDSRSGCKVYTEYCNMAEYTARLKEICPLTCNFCKICKKDKLSNCAQAKKAGYCEMDKFKDRMKNYCYESCGYCRAPSPPACSLDPQGCCWDKTSFVRDGCPVCQDSYTTLCENFKEECTNRHAPGKWMKTYCPAKCGHCVPGNECHDFDGYQEKCKEWAKSGDCNSGNVKQICPLSCQVCDKRVFHN